MTRPRPAYGALALVISALLAAGAGAGAQQPSSPLAVGVVRGDGVLLPIALLQDREWTQARVYDGSVERGLFRIRDRDLIPRSQWTLYAPGGSPQSLALRSEVTVRAHCEAQEGFATDARPAAGVLDAPHLTWAVATSRPVMAVDPHDTLNDPDEAARRAMTFASALTNAIDAERSVVPRSRLAGITAAQRARVAPEVTVLLRDRQSVDRDAYYFESRKSYSGVATYATGWIASSSGQLSLAHVSAGVDAGGESGRPVTRVLGVLRLGGDSVWVVERRYYEGTGYEVVSTGFAPRMLHASGGGC